MASIEFKTEKCTDCYKCVRVCPVKAIHTKEQHALLVSNECILCGRCLEACPQEAIIFASDMYKVKSYLQEGRPLIASLDSAYRGLFGENDESTGQVRTALYKLGFSHVRETSEGAVHITKAYEKIIAERKQDIIITSSCAAINELVEKYHQDMIPYMAPVVSPMSAHAMMLKDEFGPEAAIVYIGSCTARGREAYRETCRGQYVDAVISFMDIRKWMKEEGIELDQCEVSPREGMNAMINGLYGTARGILHSIEKDEGFGSYQYLGVDGVDDVVELFKCIRRGEIKNCFIEVCNCVAGCINGPVKGGQFSDRFKAKIFTNRKIIRRFPENVPDLDVLNKFRRGFAPAPRTEVIPSEEEIQEMLRKDGKSSLDKQLNCGGCGYKTCRDRAIALCQNKDTMNLCLPYLYQRTKSFSEVILRATPNYILTVDENMNILDVNRAFTECFNVNAVDAAGMPVKDVIDPADFNYVLSTKNNIYNKIVSYEKYHVITSQTLLYIPDQRCVMGIMRDVTLEEKIRRRHDKVRQEAIDAAQKVVEKQMLVAQEIAGLLGETTAETKMTLLKMRDSISLDEEDDVL